MQTFIELVQPFHAFNWFFGTEVIGWPVVIGLAYLLSRLGGRVREPFAAELRVYSAWTMAISLHAFVSAAVLLYLGYVLYKASRLRPEWPFLAIMGAVLLFDIYALAQLRSRKRRASRRR